MGEKEFKVEAGAKSFRAVAEDKEATGFDAKKEMEIGGKKQFIWIKKK